MCIEYEVLEYTDEGKVTLSKFLGGKKDQLWEKGQVNDEGYFTFKDSDAKLFMTATSENSLEMKGKYEIMQINRECSCFLIDHTITLKGI